MGANVILGFDGGVLVFKRKGKRLFTGAEQMPGTQGGKGTRLPMFITSIVVTDHDVTGKVICLNDKRVLYEFGKGFGTIQVQGEILLGNDRINMQGSGAAQKSKDAVATGAFSDLIDWFNENRVSQKGDRKPLTISAGSDVCKTGGTFTFYLSSFQLGQINPELGVVSYSLNGDLVEMSS